MRISLSASRIAALLVVLCALMIKPAKAVPLMDVVDIEGIRTNQLVGYGLVVGLDGTGDKNQVKFTSQSTVNMVKQFGINLPPNVDPKLKNAAAVMVTATIPPSYGPGQKIDVTVSSLGDAKSLRGGQLLMTPLMGVDGETYALAQGALIGTQVSLQAPLSANQRTSFVAMLEMLEVDTGRVRPKVVFNSRTGTVVVGEGVRVKAAAVAHGSLTVTINESSQVSQPGAFSRGQTAVTPQSDIAVDQEANAMFKWPEGASLDSIISTVNSLGATPDDVMSILQALEKAGALNAELIVI